MSAIHSPKTYRVSDEVHKALRIRAAETGETMGEIAERALRRELGMTVETLDVAGAKMTVAMLEARRKDRGALTAEEQKELGRAWAVLEGASLTWQAWLGDGVLAEGATEDEAVENAVKRYEDEVGYREGEYADRDDLVADLDVSIKEDD